MSKVRCLVNKSFKMNGNKIVKGNVVRTNVYHKYIKDLKLNITIDLDRFIY